MTQSKAPLRRVLIVDDNEDAANSLAMILKLSGYETASVYTAADALEHATLFKPDVVLLDIGLPGMDGYEVAQKMRELPGLKDIRLVAVTGYGRSDDRLRARDAGFDDHLTKPVEFAVLDRALASPQGLGGRFSLADEARAQLVRLAAGDARRASAVWRITSIARRSVRPWGWLCTATGIAWVSWGARQSARAR